MAQFIHAIQTVKSPAEYDIQVLHGQPYAAIYHYHQRGKNRLYLLDTRDRLYYPVAEWDEDDRVTGEYCYQRLLQISDKILEQRRQLQEKGIFGVELTHTEQLVPDEDRLIKDVAQDDWSA